LCDGGVGATIGHFDMWRETLTQRALFPRAAFFLAALLFALGPRAKAQIDSTFGPLPVFELHSGFWVNLHHALYQEARSRAAATSPRARQDKTARPILQIAPGAKAPMSPAEQKAWDDAVAYYAANYADKDLAFSIELILLKNQLDDFETCEEISGAKRKTCDAGLPPKLTDILDEAAGVYRAHQWPADDRANRAWIARVAPLVREQGLGLSQRLADIYQTRWPKERIWVDVTAYANASGAYTTLDPLRVTISSTDARNQGASALEVLFHEASHGIAEPVELAIARECRQRDKPIPRDLWHALLFYTTGEVIKPVLKAPAAGDSSGAEDYTPYAVREGLYRRGWEDYLRLLNRFWQPYLDGKSTFDDAIARMVSAL
jgi:hypothetical protein